MTSLRLLRLACLAIDDLAGLAAGHFSKLTCQSKGLGFLSLFLVLPALGLRMRIEEDPSMIARLRARWTPRNEGAVLGGKRHRVQREAAAPGMSS